MGLSDITVITELNIANHIDTSKADRFICYFKSFFILQTVKTAFDELDLSEEELNSLVSLQGILESDESALLQSLITPVEVVALQSRIQDLIKMRCFPLPSTEWPAIPWPPV